MNQETGIPRGYTARGWGISVFELQHEVQHGSDDVSRPLGFYEEPKSHKLTSKLSFSSADGPALVKILFGIMNSTTGGFLTSLNISASRNCGACQ